MIINDIMSRQSDLSQVIIRQQNNSITLIYEHIYIYLYICLRIYKINRKKQAKLNETV